MFSFDAILRTIRQTSILSMVHFSSPCDSYEKKKAQSVIIIMCVYFQAICACWCG